MGTKDWSDARNDGAVAVAEPRRAGPEHAAPMPIGRRVTMDYDRLSGLVMLDWGGGRRDGDPASARCFAVRHATFIVRDGYRKECVETGKLGFIEGEAMDGIPDADGFKPIRWNGTQWVFSEGGGAVSGARTVAVIEGRIRAQDAH